MCRTAFLFYLTLIDFSCQGDSQRTLGFGLLKKIKIPLLYSQDTRFSNSDYTFKDSKLYHHFLLIICDVLTLSHSSKASHLLSLQIIPHLLSLKSVFLSNLRTANQE